MIDGYGTVGFSDCTFMQWGHEGDNETKKDEWADAYSIEALGGSILIRGCEFMENKPQVYLGKEVQRAIVTGNLLTGKQRIKDDAKGNTVIDDNVSNHGARNWPFEEKLDDMPGLRAKFMKKKH